MRIAKCFIWVDPEDCVAPHNLDLNWAHDRDKVNQLALEFSKNGFDINKPALVGYALSNAIQLVSGTHRHLAAKYAKIKLPVSLWLRSDIESCWGTELWQEVIKDIPVKDLREWKVKDGFRLSPYERVELK